MTAECMAVRFMPKYHNDKIWIHYDGITSELVADGVPKDHIVLAFHPPQMLRDHISYIRSRSICKTNYELTSQRFAMAYPRNAIAYFYNRKKAIARSLGRGKGGAITLWQ